MTSELPDEPELGTVGVGVSDGDYGDISYSDEITKSIADYLRRSGVPTTEMRLMGLGSTAGVFAESVVQNVLASLVILAATKVGTFMRGTRTRKFDLEQNKQLRPCFIHIRDHRAERRNVVELLRLLPGIHRRIAEEFPNRNYTFSVQSSLLKPKLRQIHVKLENYHDLGLTTSAIARRLSKLSDSDFVFVYLKDGPYSTRPFAFDAV